MRRPIAHRDSSDGRSWRCAACGTHGRACGGDQRWATATVNRNLAAHNSECAPTVTVHLDNTDARFTLRKPRP